MSDSELLIGPAAPGLKFHVVTIGENAQQALLSLSLRR
jgi:hypothetical protein